MWKVNKTFRAAELRLGALALLLSAVALSIPAKAQDSCSIDSNRVSVVIGFPAGWFVRGDSPLRHDGHER